MYIKIALCDDDENDRKITKSQIEAYMHNNSLTGDITLFSCGEDFLSAELDNPFDIVFMDIYLPGINGVDTALKASSRNAFQLVFITTSGEHAVEAFSLNAAHYLVKPTTESAVNEAMNRCLSKMGTDWSKYINIKTNNGTVPIPVDHIVYIEVFNKTCSIHTEKSHYETNSSLDAIYEHLNNDNFMRAQRSFVVNMNFIESFSFNRIILNNGLEIVPSRTNWDKLKKQYHQFLFHLARKGGTL